MKRIRKMLEGQIFQTTFAVIGVYVFIALIGGHEGIRNSLLALAVLSSLAHQLWVAFFWRVQLHSELFRGAETPTFAVYRVGFVLLALLRFVAIVLVSRLDAGSLALAAPLRIGGAALLLALSAYGMYSVIRYFGVNRAFGSDHFFPEVRDLGFVRQRHVFGHGPFYLHRPGAAGVEGRDGDSTLPSCSSLGPLLLHGADRPGGDLRSRVIATGTLFPSHRCPDSRSPGNGRRCATTNWESCSQFVVALTPPQE